MIEWGPKYPTNISFTAGFPLATCPATPYNLGIAASRSHPITEIASWMTKPRRVTT